MLRHDRERLSSNSLSPVETLLYEVEELNALDRPRRYFDDYLHRVYGYLDFARSYGLHDQSIVDSCIDLAATFTDIFEVAADRDAKLDTWLRARERALLVIRGPIEVQMELDPIYFEAILYGNKTYEGRAYKPDSNKNYPDIRRNDRIRFRLSHRKEEFAAEVSYYGLQPNVDMVCTVGEVLFAPTVHGVYQQIPRFNGLGFQPMIDGPSEMLQLQRAAVYHTFPGYHDLISEHGFLGIQVENPQLVTAV